MSNDVRIDVLNQWKKENDVLCAELERVKQELFETVKICSERTDEVNRMRAAIINLLGKHLTGKPSRQLAEALDAYANQEVNPKLDEAIERADRFESQLATYEMNYGNLANENRNLARLVQAKDEQVKELRVELSMTNKQLSEYALIVGAARKVAAGFGMATTPDEDQLYDLIEKYFMQVKSSNF